MVVLNIDLLSSNLKPMAFLYVTQGIYCEWKYKLLLSDSEHAVMSMRILFVSRYIVIYTQWLGLALSKGLKKVFPSTHLRTETDPFPKPPVL
jgi:hypothetical protein